MGSDQRKQRKDTPVRGTAKGSSRHAGPNKATMCEKLDQYCSWLLAHNFSPFTTEDRRTAVTAFIAWARTNNVECVEDATIELFEAYQAHLFLWRKADGEPLSFGTQLARLVRIRSFFRWLTTQGTLSSDPAASLQLPRGERRLPNVILTPNEVEAVLAQPQLSTPQGLRDRAIMELLYATAARRTELIRLTIFDIDPARGVVAIRKGKGRKDRLAPAGKRALAWLSLYRERARPLLLKGRPDTNTLFVTSRGAALSPKRLTARVNRYVAAARLGKTGACHLFRHAAATAMLENGADIRYIQAILGHESLNTTQIYTRVTVSKLLEVHAASHPGLITGAMPPEYINEDDA